MNQYDVAVVGAGPGGYVAAIRASQLGLKTVIIEKDWIGGTCLNVGCIPTKALIKNAEILQTVKHAIKRGLLISEAQINMPLTLKMKNEIVKMLSGGVQVLLEANHITIVKGEAELISNHLLVVAGQEISFENLIIATGSSNDIPSISGIHSPGILSSSSILDLDYIPKSLAIIGGGVIGCEFATIFNSFGTQVTIIEMMPHLLSMLDQDLSIGIKESMINDGVDILTNHVVQEVIRKNDGYELKLSGEIKDAIMVSDVLVSVGRAPNLQGLQALKLEMDSTNRFVKVNDHLKTSIDNIYAIGDVTGQMMLAHVASAQGVIAAENIAGENRTITYDVMPNCIFTLPEIGSVGLTEERAREMYGELFVGVFPMNACGKAIAMGETNGFTKLIADKKSGKVLGAHIIGPHATELIGQMTMLMNKDGTIEDIKNTIQAHPTIGETFSEAAHLALGFPIHTL